jgi:hypothetical protein
MLYLKTVGISRLKNSSYFLIFLDIKGHYCNFDFYHVVYLYLEDCDSTIVAFNYIKDIENLLYSYINNSKLAICENAYTIFMKISNNSSISIKYPRYIEYLELDMQF